MDNHGFPESLPYDFVADPEAGMPAPPSFTPVPMLRVRRNGWTPKRQRAFIAALCQWGSVTKAARAVGMSSRSAYRLLDKDGCLSFARAWDKAVDQARERLRVDSLDRALHGSFVPVYRQGRLVRVEHRRNDRLAIALLSGRDELRIAEIAHDRRHKVERAAELKRDYRDYDAADAEIAAVNAEWDALRARTTAAYRLKADVIRRATHPRVIRM